MCNHNSMCSLKISSNDNFEVEFEIGFADSCIGKVDSINAQIENIDIEIE